MTKTKLDVVVIGAGQAGLATGFYLKRAGLDFAIFEESDRAGSSWRSRPDGLKLFTPYKMNTLPGLRWRRRIGYPSKDEMADYLERYARYYELPIAYGHEVTSLRHSPDGFEIVAGGETVIAQEVVVATGPYRSMNIPEFAGELSTEIQQIRYDEYKSPRQVLSKKVLVVGGGNSGAELALELYKAGMDVTLSAGRKPWFVPDKILGVSLYRWMQLSGGMRARPQSSMYERLNRVGNPVAVFDLQALLLDRSVRLKPRAVGAAGREVRFADGSQESFGTIVWATGYRPRYPWLDIRGVLDNDGAPIHTTGISPLPGLYFMGMPWQTRLSSSLVKGVRADARRIVRAIKLRHAGRVPTSARQ